MAAVYPRQALTLERRKHRAASFLEDRERLLEGLREVLAELGLVPFRRQTADQSYLLLDVLP